MVSVSLGFSAGLVTVVRLFSRVGRLMVLRATLWGVATPVTCVSSVVLCCVVVSALVMLLVVLGGSLVWVRWFRNFRTTASRPLKLRVSFDATRVVVVWCVLRARVLWVRILVAMLADSIQVLVFVLLGASVTWTCWFDGGRAILNIRGWLVIVVLRRGCRWVNALVFSILVMAWLMTLGVVLGNIPLTRWPEKAQ